MFVSGAKTGMAAIVALLRQILLALLQERVVCTEVVVVLFLKNIVELLIETGDTQIRRQVNVAFV